MRKMDMLHGSIGDKTVSFAILLAVTGIASSFSMPSTSSSWGVLLVRKPWPPVGSNAPVVGLLVTFFVGDFPWRERRHFPVHGAGKSGKSKKGRAYDDRLRRSGGHSFCRARRFQRGFSRQAPSGAKGSRDNVPRVPGNHIHRDARASLSITSPRRFSGVRAIRGRRSCASLRPAPCQGMSEPFPCRLLRHGCRRRGGFHRLCDAHELFASSLPHEEYEERDPHFLP